MGGNLSGLGEAGDTDAVAHDGTLVQLQQSHIVPEEGDTPEFRANQSAAINPQWLFPPTLLWSGSHSHPSAPRFLFIPPEAQEERDSD